MMKKRFTLFKMAFLLCAMILGGVSPAWADTEKITLSEQGYNNAEQVSSTEGTVVTLTYTDGANPTTYYNVGTGVRVYADGKMTVTANGNTITKVVVTYAKNNSPTIGWASNGETTKNTTDSPATWEGSATSVDFLVSNKGHARIQVVEVTYSGGGGAQKPATPTFSPAAGTYTSAQNVTISTTTSDATIYYTTDGTTPTNQSSIYSSSIAVAATTTIKAIAVKDSESSDVATAEYVIDLTPTIAFDGQQNPYNVPFTAGETNIHYVAANTGALSPITCDANGDATTYDWFRAEISSPTYVKVEWEANEDTENSRVACFKLSDGTTTSEIFTLIQAKYVADYATLPFAFDGGKNNIATTTGLTQDGLGTDYNSSPKLKFDGTGDWVILKIHEAPGKLTFNIKGNSFSGGTFKVQTSADGETYEDLETYTELDDTQNEVFDNLAANVRYIKWIYTEKSIGNVALGNIKLEKPFTDPVITIDELDKVILVNDVGTITNHEAQTIKVYYSNFSTTPAIGAFDVVYCDKDGNAVDKTEAGYDWITSMTNNWVSNDYATMDCSFAANTKKTSRTAYVKIHAKDGDTDVYSDVATITQAKYINSTYSLATTMKPGKHYIIVGKTEKDDVYAMGGQNSNNRAGVLVDPNADGTISVTRDVPVCEFLVSMDGEFYTFYDETEGGYLYAASNSSNHLKTQAENNANGKWTIDIDSFDGEATVVAQGNNGRNTIKFNADNTLFSCYASDNNQQSIYLYENNDELAVPIAAACTDGNKCFGTFSSTKPFVVPDDLTVSEIAIQADGTMQFANYSTGDIVPANTGVMVSAAEGGYYAVNVSTDEGTSQLGASNALRPTGDSGITADEMTTADESCLFYRLTMHGGTEIGFWWGAADGAAFDVAANKAYMAVPATVSAREGFGFDNGTTGISDASRQNNKEQIIKNNWYDLQGRKVNTPTKGLYIVNGKKVVVK